MKILFTRKLPIFVLTMVVGLWFGGFFERHLFKIHYFENFSVEEIENLRGKSVRDFCAGQVMGKSRTGRVIGSTSDWGFKRVKIKYDNKSVRDWDVATPKNWFKKCVEVIDNEN